MAEGLLKLLGRPDLSILTLLVREAAQNSWDARLADCSVVNFRIDLSTASVAHVGAWRRLLTGTAPDGFLDDKFRRLAGGQEIRLLSVTDRGTHGLGGPTRSGIRPAPGERRGWVRYVLNSGDRSNETGEEDTGGTFGFGKAAFYLASRVRTVVIYTRFLDPEGNLRTRLIGSSLGQSFWQDAKGFTGRHFWGAVGMDHCEPLIDGAADRQAHDLGIRRFVGDETGTTVVIVDPDLKDPALPDDVEQLMSTEYAGRYLADAAAWNLWPITLDELDQRMQLTVSANGVLVPVPTPRSDPALAHLADAYRRVRAGRGRTIKCGKPVQELAEFAHEDTFGTSVDSPAARELGLDGPLHHICLIRKPDLVTSYFAGHERPNPLVGYLGVARIKDDMAKLFAASEPASHDRWVATNLPADFPADTPANVVKYGERFIRTVGVKLKELCDAISGVAGKRDYKVGDTTVGPIAHRLGRILAGPGGTGAALAYEAPTPGVVPALTPWSATQTTHGHAHVDGEVSEPSLGENFDWTNEPSAGPEASSRPIGPVLPGATSPRPTLIESPRFDVFEGKPVLVQAVRLRGPGLVEGRVQVVTGEGKAEDTAPAGAAQPVVHGWRQPGGAFTGGARFRHFSGPADIELLISAIPDAMLLIDVASVAL